MRRTLACLLLAVASLAAGAQEPPPEVMSRQNGGVYVQPPAQVDRIYTPPQAGEGAPAAAPANTLALRLALELPLRRGSAVGRATQGGGLGSATLQATLRWTPVHDSWWFAQATLYRYLQPDRRQPWHPDFSYSFGYDDWHPGTWSWQYANYTGTRFEPAAGQGRFNFPQGQWTLTRRFALPPAWQAWLLVGDGDQAACSANAHYMPRYVEYTTGGLRSGKTSASLGCRYQRPEGWYADLAVYAYARRDQQQPWDPDFTYGFGYAGPHAGAISLRYSNYSGNRFPGRSLGTGEGRLTSGSLGLSWSTGW